MSLDLAALGMQIEAALMARTGSKREGDELRFRCLQHDDENASAGYNTIKRVWKCHGCGAKGGAKALADLLGIDIPKLKVKARRSNRRLVAVYDYVGENGTLLFQKCRFEPKDFQCRRPDGNGGYVYSLDDVRRVIFRLPDVLKAVETGEFVFVVEGEKDANTLAKLGLTATTNPGGSDEWRPEYSEMLRGADVVMLPDQDEPGLAHGAAVARALMGVARSVRVVHVPDAKDVTEWLKAGHTKDDLLQLIEVRPCALADVAETFRNWLYLPDVGQIYVLLATIVANRLPGDPVWLLIVGPSGGGKTELLNALLGLPDVHKAGTLTAASLLSGTPRREHASDSKGGLLRKIGDYGILWLKDFGSVLSMPRDARAETIAALRELYDGSWTRHVGVEGGRELTWTGKLAVIGGSTDAIDQHHAVVGVLGERFCFYRLPETDGIEQAVRALDHAWDSTRMRRELADAVHTLLSTLPLAHPPRPSIIDRRRFAQLANLAARCRTPVVRDPYKREIDDIPSAEAPARIAKALAYLHAGLLLLGVDRAVAWWLICKVGFDSMPKLRRSVFAVLAAEREPLDTSAVAKRTKYPTQTVRRTLEDLHAYDIVDREVGGGGKADKWKLSKWTRDLLNAVLTVPEMSEPGNGHAGEETVPEMSEEASEGRSSSSLFNTPNIMQEDFSGTVPSEDQPAVFHDDAREDV